MIRQIRYFQAVVRNNSFSEAAEECHISQSAISQQIQALERESGLSQKSLPLTAIAFLFLLISLYRMLL